MTARRRILLAPVTVSPTKPLTPSHLKVLLSMDLLHRGTATFADVTHLYHPLAHAGSRQVAGFWEFLDRRHPGEDFGASTEEEIGELYAEFHRDERVPYSALEPYVRRAGGGWAHPVSERLLDLWESHYRTLGMRDPRFGRTGPGRMPVAELIELLVRNDLCIDGRPLGAPVYLDATPAGLPLRMLVGSDGHANYLASTMGEILPQLAGHDHVVLAHDAEVRSDYRTIAHVLTALGAEVSRVELPRVPVDGVVTSARFGGWRGYTVGALAPPLVAEFGAPAFALGLRLHIVAGLGRTARESFALRHLRRWVQRAGRLLAEHGDRPGEAGGVCLSALAGRLPYVDPYRLMTTLLSRDAAVPAADLLPVVVDLAGTVDRALIHRRNPAEAFLTGAIRTGPAGFAATARLPAAHPHYAGRTDPMLLLECARQAETYAAHTMFDVDLDAHFVLRNWSAEFTGGLPPVAELQMTAVTRSARLRGMEYDLELWAGGAQAGRVRMEVGYVSTAAYGVLRSRKHGGSPPSSDDLVPADGRPVAPARVGRGRATDALLIDVVTAARTVTAVLRVPVENPSLFDHAQDHVPAMVLVEGARQLAALATWEWGGEAPDRTQMAAMSSAFAAYAELNEPIQMTATPADGQCVQVTFRQAGTQIAQAQIALRAPDRERGAAWVTQPS